MTAASGSAVVENPLTLTCAISNANIDAVVSWSGGDIASSGISATQSNEYLVANKVIDGTTLESTLVVSPVKLQSFGTSSVTFTCFVPRGSGQIIISVVAPGTLLFLIIMNYEIEIIILQEYWYKIYDHVYFMTIPY